MVSVTEFFFPLYYVLQNRYSTEDIVVRSYWHTYLLDNQELREVLSLGGNIHLIKSWAWNQ